MRHDPVRRLATTPAAANGSRLAGDCQPQHQVGGHESFWDWGNGAGIGIAFY